MAQPWSRPQAPSWLFSGQPDLRYGTFRMCHNRALWQVMGSRLSRRYQMPRHVAKRLALLVVIALLIVVAATAAFAGRLAHGAVWADVVRVIVAVACVGLLVWLIFYTTDIRVQRSLDRPKPLP